MTELSRKAALLRWVLRFGQARQIGDSGGRRPALFRVLQGSICRRMTALMRPAAHRGGCGRLVLSRSS